MLSATAGEIQSSIVVLKTAADRINNDVDSLGSKGSAKNSLETAVDRLTRLVQTQAAVRDILQSLSSKADICLQAAQVALNQALMRQQPRGSESTSQQPLTLTDGCTFTAIAPIPIPTQEPEYRPRLQPFLTSTAGAEASYSASAASASDTASPPAASALGPSPTAYLSRSARHKMARLIMSELRLSSKGFHADSNNVGGVMAKRSRKAIRQLLGQAYEKCLRNRVPLAKLQADLKLGVEDSSPICIELLKLIKELAGQQLLSKPKDAKGDWWLEGNFEENHPVPLQPRDVVIWEFKDGQWQTILFLVHDALARFPLARYVWRPPKLEPGSAYKIAERKVQQRQHSLDRAREILAATANSPITKSMAKLENAVQLAEEQLQRAKSDANKPKSVAIQACGLGSDSDEDSDSDFGSEQDDFSSLPRPSQDEAAARAYSSYLASVTESFGHALPIDKPARNANKRAGYSTKDDTGTQIRVTHHFALWPAQGHPANSYNMTCNGQLNNTVGCYTAAVKHVMGLGNRMWQIAHPTGFKEALDLLDRLYGDNDKHAKFGACTGHAVNICVEVACHTDNDFGMCIDFVNGVFSGGDFCLVDHGLHLAMPTGTLACFESSELRHHISPTTGSFRHSHVGFTKKATAVPGAFLALLSMGDAEFKCVQGKLEMIV
ncbi:hypothetical protein HK405_004897 [Cladochytrium tenue]|nr:hypothetical protein HK405_004897 [Cladochytrium tenue]